METQTCQNIDILLMIAIKLQSGPTYRDSWSPAINILIITNNLSPGLSICLFCDDISILLQLNTIYSRRFNPFATQPPKRGSLAAQPPSILIGYSLCKNMAPINIRAGKIRLKNRDRGRKQG